MSTENYFNEFHKLTINQKPRDMAIETNKFIQNNSTILDLGCGAGNDSIYFACNKHKVIAVDIVTKILEKNLNDIPTNISKNIQIVEENIINMNFPKTNVIYSSLTLPFLGKENFNTLFLKIKNSLPSKGIISIDLFGQDDEWNTKNSSLVFHNLEEIKNIFQNFEILKINELQKLGTCMGENGKPIPKFWHRYHIIAKKH